MSLEHFRSSVRPIFLRATTNEHGPTADNAGQREREEVGGELEEDAVELRGFCGGSERCVVFV